jgi:hypothetical protein
MTFADVEIHVLKQEPEKGHPIDIRVDGFRHYPRGYLRAGSNPPTPTDAHYADQTYGEKLFEWFFADPQLALNWAEIRGGDRPRRIRLFIDADQAELAELHRWPWEALWEPARDGQPARPLAADPDTPFSRYLAVKAALVEPISRRPIRILVIAPRQTDFEEKYPKDKNPDMAVIDPESEFRSLQAALQPLIDQGAVDMWPLPKPCTLAAMADELSRARAENKGYHILHIISHGFYQNEQAFLLLADADNRVKGEADQDILPVLRQQPHDAEDESTLRLVFLASCETAKRSSADAFRGLAPQLVRAGLPAVVAMQAQVGKRTARQFALKFYQQLLRHGHVDLAANEARQILVAARLPGPVIPVLFLRLRDGRLFVPATVVATTLGADQHHMLRLKKLDGIGPPSYETSNRLVTIGRGGKNQVVINHPQVSWEHGQIILQEGAYHYRHLSNSNTTTIQSLGRSPQVIKPGDKANYPLFNGNRLTLGAGLAVFLITFDLLSEDDRYVPTEPSADMVP